jgi:hypothetical protein
MFVDAALATTHSSLSAEREGIGHRAGDVVARLFGFRYCWV